MMSILSKVAFDRIMKNEDDFTIQLSSVLMKKTIESVNKYAGKTIIAENSTEFKIFLSFQYL